jgi:hypothetical protein
MNQDPSTFFNTWNSQYNPQQPQIFNPHWKIPQQFQYPSPWVQWSAQPVQNSPWPLNW